MFDNTLQRALMTDQPEPFAMWDIGASHVSYHSTSYQMGQQKHARLWSSLQWAMFQHCPGR
eukprot:2237135-Prorocentrum_lima.AAC.1